MSRCFEMFFSNREITRSITEWNKLEVTAMFVCINGYISYLPRIDLHLNLLPFLFEGSTDSGFVINVENGWSKWPVYLLISWASGLQHPPDHKVSVSLSLTFLKYRLHVRNYFLIFIETQPSYFWFSANFIWLDKQALKAQYKMNII